MHSHRGGSGTHLEARIGDLAVGSLKMDFKSGGDETWHWSLYVGTHPGSLRRDIARAAVLKAEKQPP